MKFSADFVILFDRVFNAALLTMSDTADPQLSFIILYSWLSTFIPNADVSAAGHPFGGRPTDFLRLK